MYGYICVVKVFFEYILSTTQQKHNMANLTELKNPD